MTRTSKSSRWHGFARVAVVLGLTSMLVRCDWSTLPAGEPITTDTTSGTVAPSSEKLQVTFTHSPFDVVLYSDAVLLPTENTITLPVDNEVVDTVMVLANVMKANGTTADTTISPTAGYTWSFEPVDGMSVKIDTVTTSTGTTIKPDTTAVPNPFSVITFGPQSTAFEAIMQIPFTAATAAFTVTVRNSHNVVVMGPFKLTIVAQ